MLNNTIGATFEFTWVRHSIIELDGFTNLLDVLLWFTASRSSYNCCCCVRTNRCQPTIRILQMCWCTSAEPSSDSYSRKCLKMESSSWGLWYAERLSANAT